jgi:hypothetical protein
MSSNSVALEQPADHVNPFMHVAECRQLVWSNRPRIAVRQMSIDIADDLGRGVHKRVHVGSHNGWLDMPAHIAPKRSDPPKLGAGYDVGVLGWMQPDEVLECDHGLRECVARNELVVHYQPLIDLVAASSSTTS